MTEKTPKAAVEAPAEKTAAELLLEMQLEEQRRKLVNPLAVEREEDLDGSEKIEGGASIVKRTVFANGTVVENYA